MAQTKIINCPNFNCQKIMIAIIKDGKRNIKCKYCNYTEVNGTIKNKGTKKCGDLLV